MNSETGCDEFGGFASDKIERNLIRPQNPMHRPQFLDLSPNLRVRHGLGACSGLMQFPHTVQELLEILRCVFLAAYGAEKGRHLTQ
jgi:hypothetical protein